MPLTPLDIHNKEFKRSFRGYNELEVDAFLDEVVRDFEALIKDNASLREQVQALSARLDHYRQLENTLQNTLIVAQETAEEVKASARKEAELIVREAQLEADRIVKLAEERVQRLQEVAENLRRQMQLFRAKARTMLEAQMELLEADWGVDDGQEEGRDGHAFSLPGEVAADELAAAGPEPPVPGDGGEGGDRADQVTGALAGTPAYGAEALRPGGDLSP